MDAPCKECEKRVIGCHSKCEEYIKYKTEAANKEKERRRKKAEYNDLRGYSKAKHKRLTGGKNE